MKNIVSRVETLFREYDNLTEKEIRSRTFEDWWFNSDPNIYFFASEDEAREFVKEFQKVHELGKADVVDGGWIKKHWYTWYFTGLMWDDVSIEEAESYRGEKNVYFYGL